MVRHQVLFFVLLLTACSTPTRIEPVEYRVTLIATVYPAASGTTGYQDVVWWHGHEPAAFADSTASPWSVTFTAWSGELVYVESKWHSPRSGSLRVAVLVDGVQVVETVSTFPYTSPSAWTKLP